MRLAQFMSAAQNAILVQNSKVARSQKELETLRTECLTFQKEIEARAGENVEVRAQMGEIKMAIENLYAMIQQQHKRSLQLSLQENSMLLSSAW